MATPINKEWVLTSLMQGVPKDTDFTTRETPYPTITDGEYIIKAEHFSVDPYLRGFLNNPSLLGAAVPLYVVGTIVESKNQQMKVGDVVTGILPCQLYIKSNDITIRKINTTAAPTIPLYHYVGVLGMPGATAYNMAKKVRKDDVVFCGASCGIVGSLMGPLAKKAGAKLLIGSAGGPEKCKRAVEEFQYDVCLDYTKYRSLATDEEKIEAFSADLKAVFAEYNVDGVSLFYDLIGGYMSDAMWPLMTYGFRAVIVGAIDEYNQEAKKGPRFLSTVLYKAGTIYTQFVFDHFGPQFKEFDVEFENAFIPMINAKELPTVVTFVENFEMTKAFQGLFTGANVGKMFVNP